MANIKRANASGITKSGAAIADVPDAPTIGTATGGQAAATVTFTAAATGGTPTTYTATSSPGSITGTASSSPITISGLTNGTAYTFTVTATNSTGTSPASSASNSVTPASLGDMDPIAMVTVDSAGSSSITFSSIPQTYSHLQLRVIGRTNRSGNAYDAFLIKINNDATSANYTYHYLNGDGASATSGQENGSYGGAVVYRIGGATAPANTFGVVITDILNYVSTSKYKTLKSLGGVDYNGSSPLGEIYFGSNLWLSTSAITSLVIVPRTGTNFVQYSQFALYGIK